VEAAICPHPGGAPICWCRIPLPGLPLAFARRHGIDLALSTLIGTSAAHPTIATALGARHVSLGRKSAS
jgi:histidinol phosphatase-like enzyme